MIDLEQYKLVKGLLNVKPVVDDIRGMNGTAAVLRFNAFVDEVESIASNLLQEEINMLIEVPHQKDYILELRNTVPKRFLRIDGIAGYGQCSVHLVVNDVESPGLGVTDELDFITLNQSVALGDWVAIRIKDLDNAQDLSLSILYERIVSIGEAP